MSADPPAGPLRPRPLVVTGDDQLLDDLLRLAAAVGAELDVAHDVGTARSRWSAAPLVLVGDDLANLLGVVLPPRREDVYVVGADPDDAETFRRAVLLGARDVLHLPADERAVVDRIADAVDGPLPAPDVLAVVGACGGAGASVLATAIGRVAADQGSPTCLVDLDALGGGLDVLAGAVEVGGLRWPDLLGTRGRTGARALRDQLPQVDGLSVLSWDRGTVLELPTVAVRSVLAAVGRSHRVVVLDAPRGGGPAAEEAVSGASTALLVVPGTVRGVAAARRSVQVLSALVVDVRVVLRRTRSGLSAAQVGEALGLPVLGSLGEESKVAERIDAGEVPGARAGALREGAERVLDAVLGSGVRRVA